MLAYKGVMSIRVWLYPLKAALQNFILRRKFEAFYERQLVPNSPFLTKEECHAEFNSTKDDMLVRLFAHLSQTQVLDVGCNDGRTSIYYGDLLPNATFHLFEAHPFVAEKAANRIAQHPHPDRFHLNCFAVGEVPGEAVLHVSRMPDANDWRAEVSNSSSLLPPKLHKERYHGVKFDDQLTVEVKTLAAHVDQVGIQPDFLHIDVQGFELSALRGMGDYLKQLTAIWIEVETIELYEGQPLKLDVEAYLSSAGFECVLDLGRKQVGDQFWVKPKALSRVQAQ